MKKTKIEKQNAYVEFVQLTNKETGKNYKYLKVSIALDNGEVFDSLIDLKIADKTRKAKCYYLLSKHIG